MFQANGFLAISYAFINRILSDSTPPFDSITRTHSISFVSIILNVRSLLTFFFPTFSATHLSISAFCEMKFAIDLLAIDFLNLKANFSALGRVVLLETVNSTLLFHFSLQSLNFYLRNLSFS
ncbi:hypothetical protein CDIK_0039 [Cucumispora dikerogammari]|nr:hypothetical protein CDIK_0039 [Cucumispora dikerogammari]